MRQKASVVSTEGEYAVVKVDRASMCDGCHKSGCSDSCALYRIFGAKTEFSAWALNDAGASENDRVIIEASEKNVNFNAFIVFIVPILIAAAVYFSLSSLLDESLRILFAVVSFVLYFAILIVFDKVKKNKAPDIRIVEIIGADTDHAKL